MNLFDLLAVSLLPLPSESLLALVHSDPDRKDLERRWHIRRFDRRVRRFLSVCSLHGDTLVFCGDDAYPRALLDLEHPPFRLHIRGPWPLSGFEGALSVCGTRHPDAAALAATSRLTGEIVRQGPAVVTTHVAGIDRMVRKTVRAEGGLGCICCDCGLETDRIRGNGSLDGLVLISPFEPDQVVSRQCCLSRNVLTAGLGSALVVVQAPLGSGALLCAGCALDAGREVFVHRTGLRSGQLNEGTSFLHEEGAAAIERYGDILRCKGI